jgi:endonuclease/exonuclease/phosphatase family metal-dependent hydrolase
LGNWATRQVGRVRLRPFLIVSLNFHHTITADVAQIVAAAVEGIRALDVVTLSDAVGGFNPAAVRLALARSPRSECPFTASRFRPLSGAWL